MGPRSKSLNNPLLSDSIPNLQKISNTCEIDIFYKQKYETDYGIGIFY